MDTVQTIFAIRLNDGTLFHTSNIGELEKYFDAHQDEIRYLRNYYSREVFEHCELREDAGDVKCVY